MRRVTCDACSAPVGPVGFDVVWAGAERHEAADGAGIVGNYCSASCILRALNAVGVRRPAFEETKAMLDAQREADELAMAGAFDDSDPAAVEASLPYTPPCAECADLFIFNRKCDVHAEVAVSS